MCEEIIFPADVALIAHDAVVYDFGYRPAFDADEVGMPRPVECLLVAGNVLAERMLGNKSAACQQVERVVDSGPRNFMAVRAHRQVELVGIEMTFTLHHMIEYLIPLRRCAELSVTEVVRKIITCIQSFHR